ncbi:MAG: hypothetical protein HY092_01120 [Candidatus Kerfeldbacteria bacterium]|nr:hypothetical protein [Candidatus Kerfeldbacteria bacterium]
MPRIKRFLAGEMISDQLFDRVVIAAGEALPDCLQHGRPGSYAKVLLFTIVRQDFITVVLTVDNPIGASGNQFFEPDQCHRPEQFYELGSRGFGVALLTNVVDGFDVIPGRGRCDRILVFEEHVGGA